MYDIGNDTFINIKKYWRDARWLRKGGVLSKDSVGVEGGSSVWVKLMEVSVV